MRPLTTVYIILSWLGYALLAAPLASAQSLTENFNGSTALGLTYDQLESKNFTLDGGMLRTFGTVGGQALVTASCPLQDTASWSFKLRMDFEPSDVNQSTFWLTADLPDPDRAIGWALRCGRNGTTDGLELIRYRYGQPRLVGTILPGRFRLNPNLSIDIQRSPRGVWTWQADTAWSITRPFTGEFTDTARLSGQWLILLCKFTTTRIGDSYIDDLSAGPFTYDRQPPALALAAAR